MAKTRMRRPPLRQVHEYFQQLHGKELSYNKILDLTAAAKSDRGVHRQHSTLAILKHTNPWRRPGRQSARLGQGAGDGSAGPFWGYIAMNRALDLACAEAIAEIFSEDLVAPESTADALGVLRKKKNLRLYPNPEESEHRAAVGPAQRRRGFVLVAGARLEGHHRRDLKVVTQRRPSEEELKAMLFGWRVVKHVKSNAIW